jgi:hypothetical protein
MVGVAIRAVARDAASRAEAKFALVVAWSAPLRCYACELSLYGHKIGYLNRKYNREGNLELLFVIFSEFFLFFLL